MNKTIKKEYSSCFYKGVIHEVLINCLKLTYFIEVNYRYQKNGTAKGLQLSYANLGNGNILVTAIAIDENEMRCLDYEDRVYFQCLSGGETLKNQGTPTGTEAIKMSNGKASIEIIPSSKGKEVSVMVLNQNFKGTYLTIEN